MCATERGLAYETETTEEATHPIPRRVSATVEVFHIRRHLTNTNRRSYNDGTQYSMWTEMRGKIMDYKARIITMVERITDERILRRIHNFVELWYAKAS